jgi:hypothetical protein
MQDKEARSTEERSFSEEAGAGRKAPKRLLFTGRVPSAPAHPTVMPAQAGIHDFLRSVSAIFLP